MTTSPCHPASNGLAEHAVQTFKRSMKMSTNSLEEYVPKFLFKYRLAPHTSTGRPPAELLMGRQPRTLLDMICPSIASNIRCKQESLKIQHDAHAHQCYFQVGDPVYVRDFSSSHSTPAWIKGEVMECRRPLSYAVCLADGGTVQQHVDHIQTRPQSFSSSSSTNNHR